MILTASRWARQVLSIGRVNLRRLVADRAAVGYLLMLPLLVTLLVGAAGHAASRQRVGVLASSDAPAAAVLVQRLASSPALDVHRYASEGSLERAVRIGDVLAGIIIREPSATTPKVEFVTDLGQAYPTTARLAVESAVGSLDAAPGSPKPTFEADRQATEAGYGQASRGNLVLFVFLSTVSGAGGVAATRRLGIGRRIMAAPLSTTQVVLGELLGRFVIAVVQAAFIVVAAWALFGIVVGGTDRCLGHDRLVRCAQRRRLRRAREPPLGPRPRA